MDILLGNKKAPSTSRICLSIKIVQVISIRMKLVAAVTTIIVIIIKMK